MHVSTASFAYPEVDGAARSDLAQRLAVREAPPDVFVFSTCLRTEVVVHGDRADLEQAVNRAFGEPSVLELATVRTGDKAVEHIFRISAGLESPILGEREILTQFRQAVQAAQEARVVGGLLGKMLETAVAVGRQARELLPESPHDSMAAVAAQVVGPFDRVAVLGSGMMAKAVVYGMLGLPAPPDIVMVARHPEKVTFDNIAVWTFDRAPAVLDEFPAVISATSAKQRLISDADLASVLAARSVPLTLVDMAMPPDFAPPAGSPVDYVDIDHLANMAARRPRRDDADALVTTAAANAYRHLADHATVGPVIGGLMRNADETVNGVVDRFAGRLGKGDDRALLQQTAHTVARTLLARPVSYIRSADGPRDAVDVIAEAFGLDDGLDDI